MRILLVEDDPQLGRITQIGLEQLGMTVDWLQRGETVLSAVSTHDYACLLLDLGLQTMDGMQLLRSLQRGTRAYQGAILIVTARDQIPDRIAGLDEEQTILLSNLSIWMSWRQGCVRLADAAMDVCMKYCNMVS
jgi:two-component system OmpR family response regulator/two-component system response regulator QseB